MEYVHLSLKYNGKWDRRLVIFAFMKRRENQKREEKKCANAGWEQKNQKRKNNYRINDDSNPDALEIGIKYFRNLALLNIVNNLLNKKKPQKSSWEIWCTDNNGIKQQNFHIGRERMHYELY